LVFKPGPIEGVVVQNLKRHTDHRGWLMELFRSDEILEEFRPAMAYVSSSEPGVVRGPHEHRTQADFFCFIGPSAFRVFMWDNRKASRTFGHKLIIDAGDQNPKAFIIPPGVVHAYKNIGTMTGWVINMPNRLYRGRQRSEAPDEVRHENDPNTVFTLD